MSDTPRTDAAVIDNSEFSDWGSGESPYVMADFARTLERELNAQRAEAGAWRPMDTAPKDGTKILIICATDEEPEIEITEWYTINHFTYDHVEGEMYRRVPIPGYSGWNGNGHRATHWAQLPDAPSMNSPRSEG